MVADGQVAIDIKATQVAPVRPSASVSIDVACKGGSKGAPLALASSAAGVVKEVGKGVEGLSVGDAVAVALKPGEMRALLEVDAGRVMPSPKGSSFQQSATLVHVATTVMLGLGHDLACNLGRIKGKTVAVCGGKGPAGSLAIQMLSAAGADVVACVGSKGEGKAMTKLGAARCLVYKEDSFFEELGGKGLHLVVDALCGGGNEETVLRARGVRYADVTSPAVELVREQGIFVGGLKLNDFNKKIKEGKADCEAFPTDVGVVGLRSLFEAAGRGLKGGLMFEGETYTVGEWLEANGWPTDSETGGRYGFPGKSLFRGFSDASDEPEEDIVEITFVGKGIEEKEDEDAANGGEAGGGVVDAKTIGEIESQIGGGARTMVYFYSRTCRACKGMSPRFTKLAESRKGTGDLMLSADAKMLGAGAVEERWGVVEMPSFVVFKGGKVVGSWTGTFEAMDLRRMLEGMM